MAGTDRLKGSTPEWVSAFERFYRKFPALYLSTYQENCSSSAGEDGCPQVWKAVGDELVFCGTVSNKKSVATALSSFIFSLQAYRKELRSEGLALDVKGTAWLAAFPEPNRALRLQRSHDEDQLLSASEALEAGADTLPFEYDFLGKAIDTGFRVSGFARPERFILSVQLARILVNDAANLGFAYKIRFGKPEQLKGVNQNEPYPLLYIDTFDHLPTKDIKLQERTLLNQQNSDAESDIQKYLISYCEVVGTDEISLKLDKSSGPVEPPDSYAKHRPLIAAHLTGEKESGDNLVSEPPNLGSNTGNLKFAEDLKGPNGKEKK